MLSGEAVNKFKSLYLKKYGKKISQEQAVDLATRLLTLFQAIYKPIPKKDLDYSKKGGLKLK